jgi:protein phosphatase 2C family protein 2/3
MQDLRHASASVQGRRPYNEDRSHSLHPLIPPSSTDPSTSFFAVFDGHGGEEAVDWVSSRLADCIASQPDYTTGDKHRAIEQGFLHCDQLLTTASTTTPIGSSGTTCGCVLIDSTHIYTGNCGDTRNVLARSNSDPIELTVDHKPTDPSERSRIEAGGGKVTINEIPVGKNGKKTVIIQSYVELGEAGLAVSRAFGDLSFKRDGERGVDEQVVICRPYVGRRERTVDDEFVVLASDGLWNFVPTDVVIEFVRSRLKSDSEHDRDLEDIACKLTQLALDKKSNDNVTVTIVAFPRAWQLNKDREEEKKNNDA